MATTVDEEFQNQIIQLVREGIRQAINPTPRAEELLDDSQSAKILSLAKGTLAVWRTQGKGPTYVKIGANVRYKYSELQRFIEAETIKQ